MIYELFDDLFSTCSQLSSTILMGGAVVVAVVVLLSPFLAGANVGAGSWSLAEPGK